MFRIDLFFAPTAIRSGLLDKLRVAAWTPPRQWLASTLLLLLRIFLLVGMPFLDARKVSDSPADGA